VYPGLPTKPDADPIPHVLTAAKDLLFFVPEVQLHADGEKDALGFLPGAVYDEAAQHENLLVAVVSRSGLNVYAGHLLFGGRFPHARVYQLYVVPEFRTYGIGRALLDKLIGITENRSYLSISARVAADLEANSFWQAMGFEVAGVRPGGPTRRRTINVRVKQLNTRTLFSLVSDEDQDLGLVDKLAIREPVYLIDLNVFWDVVRQRPRSAYANEVVSAALRQLVHVVVAPEFIRELNRTSRPMPSDPALEFAIQLPILPEPTAENVAALVAELGRLVFPAKTANDALSVQDRSDLAHLAVAVHHNVNAFVTSEEAMLRAGDAIHVRYGVEVLHVEEFASALKDAQRLVPPFKAQLSSNTLDIWELVSTNSSQVETFLTTNPAPFDYREDFLAAGAIGSARKRIAVTSDNQIVCLASWDTTAGIHARANVRLIADEEHPAVETVLNCTIARVCNEASRVGPVLLRLCTPPGHILSKKVALLHGFRPPEVPESGASDFLQKLSLGRPVTPSNWSKIRRTVQQCSGLVLPQELPDCGSANAEVTFVTANGFHRTLSVPRLENLMSPTLLVGPNRSGAITPIRRVYSERLLQASQQLLLEPNREAALFTERVYFSTCRNQRVLAPNTALLFYESGGGGGRASAVALARVRNTEVHTKREISAELFRHGVLDSDDLTELTASDSVAVTTFDNVMPLERPVPLDRLRELGCADGSNLVTARALAQKQIQAIIEEGFPHG
jgi:ribosomal protein S18 acetylase RimI-like enzyme/predicted nucleic acid-binding protein